MDVVSTIFGSANTANERTCSSLIPEPTVLSDDRSSVVACIAAVMRR